ncbi:MAG: carboxymuconolactone decarboxylase family protein [Planctomycetes bacterium]|nr:carboxymuconolactone decarboxylase family protein [Planctomycetota bacterium]
MAWIRTIRPEDADGPLAETYAAAVKRAGRVYQILQAMSLTPDVLDASMGLYQRVMFQKEGLSRRRREMLAVVTSRTNRCHY